MRILLIEDYEGCVEGFVVMMEEYLPEATVTCCATLACAVDAVVAERFDVIVLDLSLPDAKETEGVRRLMKVLRSKGEDVPIVVYTAYPQYEVACKKEGIGVFLVKANIDGHTLAATLRGIVSS